MRLFLIKFALFLVSTALVVLVVLRVISPTALAWIAGVLVTFAVLYTVVLSPGSQPKHRRILVVVMLVSIVAVGGWIYLRRMQAQKNRQRVAAFNEIKSKVKSWGGRIRSQSTRRPMTWVERLFDDPGNADDPVVAHDGHDVNLHGSRVTDDDLKLLTGITGIRSLNLQDTKVTGAGLKHLAEMTALKNLNLSGT